MTEKELNEFVKQDIPALQNYIYTILNSKDMFNVEPMDILNTAYIKLHDCGLEFSFDNMKKPIKQTILSFLFDKKIEYNPTQIQIRVVEDKVCKKCKEPKPLAMFYVNRVLGNGVVVYQSNCKTCQKVIDDANRAKRLADATAKEIHLNRKREYYKQRSEIIKGNSILLNYIREEWANKAKKSRQKKLANG